MGISDVKIDFLLILRIFPPSGTLSSDRLPAVNYFIDVLDRFMNNRRASESRTHKRYACVRTYRMVSPLTRADNQVNQKCSTCIRRRTNPGVVRTSLDCVPLGSPDCEKCGGWLSPLLHLQPFESAIYNNWSNHSVVEPELRKNRSKRAQFTSKKSQNIGAVFGSTLNHL